MEEQRPEENQPEPKKTSTLAEVFGGELKVSVIQTWSDVEGKEKQNYLTFDGDPRALLPMFGPELPVEYDGMFWTWEDKSEQRPPSPQFFKVWIRMDEPEE